MFGQVLRTGLIETAAFKKLYKFSGRWERIKLSHTLGCQRVIFHADLFGLNTRMGEHTPLASFFPKRNAGTRYGGTGAADECWDIMVEYIRNCHCLSFQGLLFFSGTNCGPVVIRLVHNVAQSS